MRLRLAALALLVLPGLCFSQKKISDALVERVDTTAFIQLDVQSFKDLNAQQKQVAYWLQQASIAIDPIIYDQLSKYGLREKRLLEEIVAYPQGAPKDAMDKIRAKIAGMK